MTKYVDKPVWEDSILIVDESTPVFGGQPQWNNDNLLAGYSNVSAAMLADRTRYLKEQIDSGGGGGGGSTENFLQKSNNLSDLNSISEAKVNLGINMVDNTSDINKPVSTATQLAIDSVLGDIDLALSIINGV